MLSLSSLEGFQISKRVDQGAAQNDDSTATPGTISNPTIPPIPTRDDRTPDLKKYFYIIQSQHPLTSAEMQVVPARGLSAQPPPVVAPVQSMMPPPPPAQRCMPPPPGYYAPPAILPPAPPSELCQPPTWLKTLLEFRKAPKAVPVSLRTSLASIKRAEDNLCTALLRAIQLIERDGPVKAKLKISKMGPASELKELVNMSNDLALTCFEQLPPGLACMKASETTTFGGDECLDVQPVHQPAMEEHSYGSDYMETMMPVGMISGPSDPQTMMVSNEYYGWSEPPRMSMMQAHAGSYAPSVMPPSSAPPAEGMWQPDGWSAAPPPPIYQPAPPPFLPFPYGMQYHRLSEARRKCGIDNSDLFPASKKGPSVGDRPLTPPAQGWYAKYSSGVTGVVWDRVHQAWVVSWTLAGKRTFRHFTCKSYGGFDKAREAAIEFRLARNREIAAYNKRCKDKK